MCGRRLDSAGALSTSRAAVEGGCARVLAGSLTLFLAIASPDLLGSIDDVCWSLLVSLALTALSDAGCMFCGVRDTRTRSLRKI